MDKCGPLWRNSPLMDLIGAMSLMNEDAHLSSQIPQTNILNNHDTSETSPRQVAFDLGIGFSPIFTFI